MTAQSVRPSLCDPVCTTQSVRPSLCDSVCATQSAGDIVEKMSSPELNHPFQQHSFNMTDRSCGIESFWTDTDAIHDASTSKDTEWIFKICKPFLRCRVPTVSQETICLQ